MDISLDMNVANYTAAVGAQTSDIRNSVREVQLLKIQATAAK